MKAVSIIIGLFIIAVSLIIGIYLYPQMPEKMASHWNTEGIVDGYMPKFWGLFLLPIVSIGMLFLFWLIPRIDPLKKNLEKFRNYFDGFILFMLLFLFYIYLLSIMWNLGYEFQMTKMIVPAVGFLLYFIGMLITHAKRNWFVGIRTPWTLSSDKVWDKTHRVGGRLFKFAGILALVAGLLLPNYSIWFIIIFLILSIVYVCAYSYFEYRKEHKNG